MYSRQKTKKHFIKLTVIVLVGLIVLGGVSFAAYKVTRNDDKPVAKTPTTADGQPVNLDPPSEDEKTVTDEHKQAIIDKEKNQQEPTTNPDTGLKSASVVISNAAKSGVGAYISNAFEDGGTCTVTATSGAQTITKTSHGFQNVSYTQCEPITFDTPLGTGSWTIKVSYSSPTSSGSASQAIRVE